MPRRQKPAPKRRNPVAPALRRLRPQTVRNAKTYTRKGRRKAPDLVRAGGWWGLDGNTA